MNELVTPFITILFIHYLQIQFMLFLVLHLTCTAGENDLFTLRGCFASVWLPTDLQLAGVKLKGVDTFRVFTLWDYL